MKKKKLKKSLQIESIKMDEYLNKKRKNCPLCGEFLKENHFQLGKTTIFCPVCSLVFNYLLSVDFDKKWEEFASNPEVLEYDLAREAFFEELWDYIRRLTKKRTGRILDIGCGRGIMLKLAKLSGWQAEGIELSQRLCKEAENYSCSKVYEGPVEKINLPPESYDIILMIDTFRHLENPLATLKRCKELCKRSGLIIIRDLNIEEHSSKERFSKSLDWDLQCLSPRTAKLFMEKSGINNVQFFPSPMSLLTQPIIKSIYKVNPEIVNKLKKIFNKTIRIFYYLSFGNWLTITPEMIIIGKK